MMVECKHSRRIKYLGALLLFCARHKYIWELLTRMQLLGFGRCICIMYEVVLF